MYLRQGEWCECERSCNTSTGRLEAGVSVYECRAAGSGKWVGTGPAFEKRERSHRGQDRKYLGGVDENGTDIAWYLVTGDQVGTGGDKEPLLKNVMAHKIVSWDGMQFFVEVSDAQDEVHCNHPGFPECTCGSIDDILDKMLRE
jgi:hypothetical protein